MLSGVLNCLRYAVIALGEVTDVGFVGELNVVWEPVHQLPIDGMGREGWVKPTGCVQACEGQQLSNPPGFPHR